MSSLNQFTQITCVSCNNPPTIDVNLLREEIYSGNCPNDNCQSPMHFVCRLCYVYSEINLQNKKGGRAAGVYSTIKNARRHVTKSETHQKALDYFEKKKTDDNVMVETKTDEVVEVNMMPDIGINENTGNPYNEKSNFHHNKQYYYYENLEKGYGAKYLVGKAFEVEPSQYNEISNDEVNFFMNVSLLLTQLTQEQQKIFATILLHASNSKDKDYSIFKLTRVPTSIEDFNHIILLNEKAIIPNLPIPTVNVTDDSSHAYVSLIDLLDHELASATEFDSYFSRESILGEGGCNDEEMISVSQSELGRKLFMQIVEPESEGDMHTMYLWVKEWRDAFDPNNTKSSRNQVWINTFTISPPHIDKNGKNTYFMAISAKSDNHSFIDDFYGKEITHLSTVGHLFYHGGQKKHIMVKLGKLATCVDRPERASMFQVGDHNGSYSNFWGYATQVDGMCIKNHLPSCISCRLRTIDQLKNNNYNTNEYNVNCNCCRWDILNNKFSFPIPEQYPKSCDGTDNAPVAPAGREIPKMNINDEINNRKRKANTDKDYRRLVSVRLNVKYLKDAIQFAHYNLITSVSNKKNSLKKFWTKGNAVAYLRTCGLSGDLINQICDYANKGLDPEYPATWYDDDAIEKSHYAGMHMLFLGHIKSNYDMLSNWMSTSNIHANFGKQANFILDKVKKLRVTKYYSPHNLSTTKWGTGNWVSENYVFLARTQKFFFVMPAIRKCKRLANDPIGIFAKQYRIVKRFVSSSHAAMSRIMSTKKTIREMHLYIKIYMDCMKEMDHDLLQIINNSTEGSNNVKEKKKVKKTTNFVKSNSLGILSVAEAHNLFGPLVLNWEGGYAGERKIQDVKPLLSIKRDNTEWQKITMQRLYQNEALLRILDSSLQKRETEGLLKVYKTINIVHEQVMKCYPLSAAVDCDDRVWIAYRQTSRSAVSLIEVIFDDTMGEEVEGICWMCPIKIGKEVTFKQSMADVMRWAKEFALLLSMPCDSPTSSPIDNYENFYYVVGSKWTERNSNGKFVWSSLNSDTLFADWGVSEQIELHETMNEIVTRI